METNTYKNGKIVGMMKAAIILQNIYTENRNGKVFNITDARERFSKECEKEGFDMFNYLREMRQS